MPIPRFGCLPGVLLCCSAFAALLPAAAAPDAASSRPDYDALIRSCTSGCCTSSVEHMRKIRALPHSGSEPCPFGYELNMYRCPGSFSWCEPKEEQPKTSPVPLPKKDNS